MMPVIFHFTDGDTLRFTVANQSAAFELAKNSFPGKVAKIETPTRKFTANGKIIHETSE